MELMKAIRIHNYGGPEVLQYEDAPSPKPAPGDVLIRIHAAGVNPADWKVREVHLKQFVQNKFPLIPRLGRVGRGGGSRPRCVAIQKRGRSLQQTRYVTGWRLRRICRRARIRGRAETEIAASRLCGGCAFGGHNRLAGGRPACARAKSKRPRAREDRSAGEAMITMSILWALVIGLFAINRERANERR